MNPLKYMSEP